MSNWDISYTRKTISLDQPLTQPDRSNYKNRFSLGAIGNRTQDLLIDHKDPRPLGEVVINVANNVLLDQADKTGWPYLDLSIEFVNGR